MSFTLKDGTGSSREAAVDVRNRLAVVATSIEAEQDAALRGKAFILHGRCHTAVASSGGLMSFTNTSSDRYYHITRIYIDAHSLTQDLIVSQLKNPTVASGTDVSSTGIMNKYFSSQESLTGTLKISDASADLTLTGGTEYHAFNVSSKTSSQRDMRLSNLLGPGDTIAWKWETYTGNAVDGEKISLSVNLTVTEED